MPTPGTNTKHTNNTMKTNISEELDKKAAVERAAANTKDEEIKNLKQSVAYLKTLIIALANIRRDALAISNVSEPNNWEYAKLEEFRNGIR